MSAASLVIKNGLIVDGTGSEPFKGDVAIKDGKILAVGAFNGDADQTIDAGGQAIAPGFIDIHTHYDPQLCWDRLATPSLEHGCTTVVIGNCSLSLAPIRDKAASRKLISMFRVIEDIAEPTFDEGVPFAWESFGDYLDHIKQGLGINVGALVGHSVLRLYVMGDAAQERAATDEEIEQMCVLLKEAMNAGAIGLSTSYVDVDENMKPVPSRFAELKEKIALAKAMVETGRGVMQTVPNFIEPGKQIECIEELGEISKASGAMCTLAPIIYAPGSDLWTESLDKLEEVNAAGGKVFGQSMPRPFDLNMRLSENSFLLLSFESWRPALQMSVPDRIKYFSDPENQKKMVAEMNAAGAIGGAFSNLRVGRVENPESKKYERRYLSEIAEELGSTVPQVIIDIALADGLDAEFQVVGAIHSDPEFVSKILDHPLCLVGASDAGAHIAQFCGAGDTCYILSKHVRERGDMTIERAVYRMTGEAAEAWGIKDRGVLKEGLAADVIVFDPATIDRGEEIFVHDFPGDANRYIRHPSGIAKVIVNGEVAVDGGEYTANRAGAIV